MAKKRKAASSRPARQIAPRRKAPDARRPVRAVREAGGPAAAPRAPAEEGPDSSRPRALAIAQAGLSKKAADVTVLDVRGLTSYADYFVLMTAESEPQASAIADAVDEELSRLGAPRLGVEGQAGGRWVLIDCGDVVAHVFNPEARLFYDLEGLWADAPRLAVGA